MVLFCVFDRTLARAPWSEGKERTAPDAPPPLLRSVCWKGWTSALQTAAVIADETQSGTSFLATLMFSPDRKDVATTIETHHAFATPKPAPTIKPGVTARLSLGPGGAGSYAQEQRGGGGNARVPRTVLAWTVGTISNVDEMRVKWELPPAAADANDASFLLDSHNAFGGELPAAAVQALVGDFALVLYDSCTHYVSIAARRPDMLFWGTEPQSGALIVGSNLTAVEEACGDTGMKGGFPADCIYELAGPYAEGTLTTMVERAEGLSTTVVPVLQRTSSSSRVCGLLGFQTQSGTNLDELNG